MDNIAIIYAKNVEMGHPEIFIIPPSLLVSIVKKLTTEDTEK